jgi:hypothetical protein
VRREIPPSSPRRRRAARHARLIATGWLQNKGRLLHHHGHLRSFALTACSPSQASGRSRPSGHGHLHEPAPSGN